MKNKTIQDIFDEIDNKFSYDKSAKDTKNFKNKYILKDVNEISWLDLCEDTKVFPTSKRLAFFLISYLLEHNMYHNEYSDELYALSSTFYKLSNRGTFNTRDLFCGEQIKNLIIYKNQTKKSYYGYAFYNSKNLYLKKEFIGFLESHRRHARNTNRYIIERFEETFDIYQIKIKNFKDFNANTFWQQINYCKTNIKDEKDRQLFLKSIISFYRYLIEKYNTYNFFKDDFNLTKSLLCAQDFVKFINKDYYFTSFDVNNRILNKTKICFLLKGRTKDSTLIVEEDYFSIDIASLKNKEYCNLILNYIYDSNSTTLITSCAQIYYIRDALIFLIQLKSQDNYPNKNLKYFSNQEGVLLKKYINNSNKTLGTKNNEIGAIRRFFYYTKNNDIFEFDDLFFDYLRQYEEPALKNNANSIKDDDLIKINNLILEKAKNDIFSKIMYGIFHISLQTEFRISQICHLKIDCIKPSIKPNQFVICSNSKTSHGKIDQFVITDMTYKLLLTIIEETENIRNDCNIEAIKDYIFLYKKQYDVRLLSPKTVANYFQDICKELNLDESYSTSNLRDTHMTKSFEYKLRNNKSDTEVNLLSGHKHIDTTKSHYIEIELEKMLETTYGIVIGEEYIETDSKIIKEIPNNLNGEEYDVENGCGKCTAKSCVITSSLPCLACKHFITTPQHEIFFKKAIENIDKLIEKTINNHDKEDLITIKKLYILYLKSIYKYKEGIYD